MEGGHIFVKTLSGQTTFLIPFIGKAFPRCARVKEEICKNVHVKELIPNLMPSCFELTRVAESDECIPHDAPIFFGSTVYIFMTKGRQEEIRWAQAPQNAFKANSEREVGPAPEFLKKSYHVEEPATTKEAKKWAMPKDFEGQSMMLKQTVADLTLFVSVTFDNRTVRFEISKRGKKFNKFKRLVAQRLGVSLDFVLVPQNGIFAKRVKRGDAFEIKIIK